MKKTLLATAIAGAMVYGATAAQAATVYDQDGTQVDVYGRINLGVTTGGEQDLSPGAQKTDGSEFVDVYSRFGFRARHQVAPDLQAFANMEFRPNLVRQNDDNMVIRNSFLGIQGDNWGMVRVGNFDGVLYQAVTSKFEIQEYLGYTSTSGGATSARGDSIQYSTPNLEGFQAHVQAKHLSGNDATVGAQDNSSAWTWQAAVNYEWQDLYLGLGYNQSRQEEEGRGYAYQSGGPNAAGEDIWAAAAIYQFTPAFRAGIKYEDVTSTNDQDTFDPQADVGLIDNMWTLMGVFDYGMGEIYGDYNRVRSVIDGEDSRNVWTLGANYRFSQPMYVWAEIHDADFDTDDSLRDLNDDLVYTVGLRYDF
jgi:outer membrane pore protein E